MTTTNKAGEVKSPCSTFAEDFRDQALLKKRCRYCGRVKAAHDLTAQDFHNIEFIAALCGFSGAKN